jgi:hypothetical protein
MYNDHEVYPEVRFTSKVFNPFVTPQMDPEKGGYSEASSGGLLDIRSAYPTWDPTIHFIVTILTFIKKTFYLKDEDLFDYDHPANPEAKAVFLEDKVIAV